ncbi:MAG TPA: RNA methyltransferase, partial [Candidatus Acidoferrales bacterium]|nr:RNA methyltransferase [Candidatus Acidoferrales bacterium]
ARLLVSLAMPREAISARKKPPMRAPERSPGPPQPEPITSRDNRWLKLFREALHDGFLATENLIGIEGPHLIAEALRSGIALDACLVSPAGEKHLAALPSASFAGARVLRTTDRLFEGVAATEHPQGIAALVRPRESTFDDLVRGDIPLVVVLAGVQDPGNVGTVVRSAEAFGATGLAATRGTADPWSSKALRASAGSALRLPLLRGMAPAVLLAQLRVAGLAILAATSKPAPSEANAIPLASADQLQSACAIFIGSEGAGLAPEILRSADSQIAVPMAAGVESLNAGVAASVILYEAARRRTERAQT